MESLPPPPPPPESTNNIRPYLIFRAKSGSRTESITNTIYSVPAWFGRYQPSESPSPYHPNHLLLQIVSQITLKDIQGAKPCGGGGFGTVRIVEHPSGEKVALKQLHLSRGQLSEDLRRRTLREGETWQDLKHPHVLPFLGILETPTDLYLVSPYVNNGALDGYLRQNPDVDRHAFLWRTAGAIAYLHEHGIIHGDIKAANILVSGDVEPLLCDFGLAKFDDGVTSIGLQGVGTIRFQSPEVLMEGSGKSLASDVWAFGMTIFEILSGKLPFHQYTIPTAIIGAIVLRDERPTLPTHSPSGVSYDHMRSMAQECWQKDPALRVSMQDFFRRFRPNGVPLRSITASVPASVHRSTTAARPTISSANLSQLFSKITPKDVSRVKSIGASGFGKVLVLDHQALGEVALKRLIVRNNMEDDTLRENTLREGMIWQSLSHPNVLPFLGVLEDEVYLYLVSPFVTNGTLDVYLSIHPDADCPKLLWEAAGAIAYLHKRNIIHGDIKASNFLISDEIHVLLCDFGLARSDGTKTPTGLRGVGTSRFQSPELLSGQGKTFKSDSWAFGMMIYQVLSSRPPFHDARGPAVINEIFYKHSRPPKFPSHSISGKSYARIWNVAENCWRTLPAERPSMQEVHRQLLPGITVLVGHSDWIRCLAFAPDGKTIASGAYDNTVRCWDIDSGMQKGEALKGHMDWIQCVVFSSDIKTIISGSNDRTIRRWDVESGKQADQTLPGLAYWIQCLAFSPGGDIIASGANDRTIRLWDVESGLQKGDALRGHTDWVGCLAFSPDGKTIVSGSNDRTLRLWDVELATQIGGVLKGHTDWVLCVAFSPDGRTIVSGSKDHTIRQWSVESMMERGNPLTGHADWVECLAFSPDGRTIASGSNDRTIRFWDLDSGAKRGDALIGHTDWVFCLAFSPDGKTLASGSYDMTVRLWALDDNS